MLRKGKTTTLCFITLQCYYDIKELHTSTRLSLRRECVLGTVPGT